jgi:enoyl-CoA hydratase/carnithine racemase
VTAAVVAEGEGAVRRLRLNRPEKLNALNDAVRAGLAGAVDALADDVTARVVVLEGAGRAFSAGADLQAGGAGGGRRPWAERRHLMGGWQRLLDAIEALPQVTVAALHGHCIGGAALLAAACDIRVADASVQMRIPELAIGIPLTWGGVPRLAREIGLPLTRDLVMTGRVMGAEEALRSGFVQRLAAEGELEKTVDGVVAELLAMPDAPLRMTKALTAALGREAVGASAWADADLLSWSLAEPEGNEAAAAYLTRRNADRDDRAGGGVEPAE